MLRQLGYDEPKGESTPVPKVYALGEKEKLIETMKKTKKLVETTKKTKKMTATTKTAKTTKKTTRTKEN